MFDTKTNKKKKFISHSFTKSWENQYLQHMQHQYFILKTCPVSDKDTCGYYQLFNFDKLLLVSVSCLVSVPVHRGPNKQPNALPKIV